MARHLPALLPLVLDGLKFLVTHRRVRKDENALVIVHRLANLLDELRLQFFALLLGHRQRDCFMA